MNKKNRFLRIGITALLALLMAGATGTMLAAALGMSSGTAAAWLSALGPLWRWPSPPLRAD